MSKELELSLENANELYSVTKALASPVRIQILKLLYYYSLNVNEISERLNIPQSTAALHVRILEKSGLINTELQPGTRGSMKLCSRKRDFITIRLKDTAKEHLQCTTIEMPIGAYVNCKVEPTCGMASEKDYIGLGDDESAFYYPARINAQIIWVGKGFLEYKFPNPMPDKSKIKMIKISAEICSEAPYFRNDHPSDITLWINGLDCGTWRSPGDFGGRLGKTNPDWWDTGMTQFGMLKTWSVTNEGSFIDDEPGSDIKIDQLDIMSKKFISVRIGNKPEAEYPCGFNLFGEKFGDYPQNIVLRIYC
jgi:predicted transcriptional regulator